MKYQRLVNDKNKIVFIHRFQGGWSIFLAHDADAPESFHYNLDSLNRSLVELGFSRVEF